jgi:O-antigen ligase
MITRAAATGAMALLILTIVKTGSRGAFLGFVGCSVYLLFNFTAITKKVRIYAVGTMVALLLTFGGPRYWEMMSTMLTPKSDNNWTGETGRKEIWIRGIGYMLTHPITGVGARVFGTAEGTISQISARQEFGIGLKWSTAHNSFVEVGAELGVFGLAAFVAALFYAWRFVRRIGRPDQATRAGPFGPLGHALGGTLVGYMIAGFFLSAGYSAFLHTVYAMVIGIMKLTAENANPVPAAVASQAPRAPVPPRAILVGAHHRAGSTGRRSNGRRHGIHPGPAPIPPRSPSVRP